MKSSIITFDAISKVENIKTIEFIEKPLSLEQQLFIIRDLRQTECFSIINRGTLWYQSLTEAQLVELSQWYNAWLDAPETLVVPEKPSWL